MFKRDQIMIRFYFIFATISILSGYGLQSIAGFTIQPKSSRRCVRSTATTLLRNTNNHHELSYYYSRSRGSKLLASTIDRESQRVENVEEEVVKKNIDELKYDNENKNNGKMQQQHQQTQKPSIVLVTGFESFNRDLYYEAAKHLPINLKVFADSDIRSTVSVHGEDAGINPEFKAAVEDCDVFIGSLIFDYDDALAVQSLLPNVKGPRLIFESATELMTFNRVGSFTMEPKADGQLAGPPPAVKAVLSKFSSGKEEDKISGYLKLLKFGPSLLKYIPGEKAGDLRTWMEAYRYWNQGGLRNVGSMLQLLYQRIVRDQLSNDDGASKLIQLDELPDLEVTPDIGLIHPLNEHKVAQTTESKNSRYFESPSSYIKWRLSPQTYEYAKEHNFQLAPPSSPKVAILLYRKHVITEQRYIMDLIKQMEQLDMVPVPIFINGVEAHTIVRDMLTSQHEVDGVNDGVIKRDDTYQPSKSICVDAIVNTVGFPLVGGPAGSMEAGRNVDVAETLLSNMNIPYIIASPLLLQSIPQWKQNGVLGLQSVVLYSLPELDGAIDTVVLGGLVGDKIALVPERVRKLASRIRGWVELKRTPKSERKIAISLYGFPPNVGAVGTAALLDVPSSLDSLLRRLSEEGYDVGSFASDPDASGESIVAALGILSENPVISAGADYMEGAVQAKIDRAKNKDPTVASTLAKDKGGLADGKVRAYDITMDELERALGKYMTKKVRRAWSEKDRGPGMSSAGKLVVSGIQLGNVFITVQPLLGVEGDPMRLLFERDLTPHPQYCAAYEWIRRPESDDGIGAQAIIHLGMHGTVEWLPGQPLGNDRQSWSDELLGGLPNVYIYAANNPSESILAKRRGYGTLVSYNVPPYGRAGLYLDLANLKDLLGEYRMAEGPEKETQGSTRSDLRDAIWGSVQRCGIMNDVPLLSDEKDEGSAIMDAELPSSITDKIFDNWVAKVSDYLVELQDRLFSSGLHVLGRFPSDDELKSYLKAYYGEETLTEEDCEYVIDTFHEAYAKGERSTGRHENFLESFFSWLSKTFTDNFLEGGHEMAEESRVTGSGDHGQLSEAIQIASLLGQTTEELDSVMNALDGGYVPSKPGGDLLRDGTSVLPTGRNIHALDPYRMPSAGAWARGQKAAEEILKQHQAMHGGDFPETVAVTLWGLDAIKTRGESVAIVLALVGAIPVKEGTGRVVRFDLIPLEDLGRPRVDVLASLSGIFRDSFANIVDLLDDMFERAAEADEAADMNYIKKHALDLKSDGVDRPAARLFSNPPGDYGSMVNEVVGTGDWEESSSLGETWKGRNVFSYGRNEGDGVATKGTARPQVLDKLLETTERVVQEIDSVEYGLTDIQEYYANTGALKKAAENRKPVDTKTGKKRKVSVSVIEAFGGPEGDKAVPVREVEDVLRLEYRSKLLNPKWRDAMLEQGSGGAYEVSQRLTTAVGWAATADVDNFVFDQAAERYALDEEVAKKLQQSNPEAFKNVVRRLLEASGRGMWETSDDVLQKLRDLYSDADDMIEQATSTIKSK